MRKTKKSGSPITNCEIVEELEKRAPRFIVSAIVVGFEKGVSYLYATELGKVEALDRLAAAGGVPLGIVGICHQPGQLAGSYSAIPGREWAEPLLADLLDGLCDDLIRVCERTASHTKSETWQN